MTMSESLPKPLPSINALRAHLKLLERGVNDARDKRVGPRPLTPNTSQRAPGPGGATASQRLRQLPDARGAIHGRQQRQAEGQAEDGRRLQRILHRVRGQARSQLNAAR